MHQGPAAVLMPSAALFPGGQGTDQQEAFSCFVGDLAPDVNDFLLQESFRQYYPSVRSAKVITDPATGRSKGYGFVRFASELERDRALEMQGFNIGGRPIRVSLATARRNGNGGGGGASSAAGAGAGVAPHPAELDPTNTTLFIGGLSAGVSEDQLRAIFGQYGDIVYTKVPAGKGCGFVQFIERPAAEMAMAALNGQIIGANAIRINWGRSTSRAPGTARNGAVAAAAPTGMGVGALGGLVGVGPAFAGANPYAAFNGSSMMAGNGFGALGGLSAPMSAPMLGSLPQQGPPQQQIPSLVSGLGLGGAHGALLGGLGFGLGGAAQGAGLPFDPLGPIGIDKLNAAFAARQQQLLGGAAFLLPRN